MPTVIRLRIRVVAVLPNGWRGVVIILIVVLIILVRV
jgi:hypothetical protein